MMLISKSSWCIFVKLPSLLDGWCLQNSEKILTFNHQMKAEHIIHHSGVFLVQNLCLNISCLSEVKINVCNVQAGSADCHPDCYWILLFIL